MMKYDSIHIFNYQSNLKLARLNGLGRINVLCGKNGSGKSTVLNAINELSKTFVYNSHNEDLGFEDFEHLFIVDTIKTQFSINDFNLNKVSKVDRVFNDEYGHIKAINRSFTREFIFEKLKEFLDQDYFKKSPSLEKISFINYFSSFLSATNLYESNYDDYDDMTHYILPVNIIREFADQIFPTRNSVKLIPNDRNLLSNCMIKDYKSCEINSERIINYINFCKGQLTDSKEHKSFLALKKAFNEISEGYSFEIIIKDGLELELLFSNREGQWINADYSGLGLRDLLALLSYIILLESDIFLIEEPERHLHSSTQRRLLMYLSEQDKQFFIATHSNVFLDLDFVDAIFTTEYVNGCINVKNESSKAQALFELGYSVADNIVSDLVILIEGPSDKNVVEYFLNKLGLLKNNIVKFWFLGGDIMAKHDLTILMESYKVIALVDNDPGSSVIRTRCKHPSNPIP